MFQEGRQSLLRQHVIAIVLVFVCLAVIGVQPVLRARLIPTPEPVTAEMGVEHTQPLSITLEMSARQGKALLFVTHEGEEETVYVSLPESWTRREVHSVPLHSVVSESAFGFRRWRFPAGASVSFSVPAVPTTFFLHNPSTIPLKVTTVRVDLETESVERDVVLVQESPVQLW